MKIAVIIPFVDRDELLKRCLDSIDERFPGFKPIYMSDDYAYYVMAKPNM